MPPDPLSLPDRVRIACAWVMDRACSVRIDEKAVEAYAKTLPAAAEPAQPDPATQIVEGDRELRAAFVICLNAINFGSGWWPTIRKRPGHSGYFTIAAGLTERFRERGAWLAQELAELTTEEIAVVVGQDAEHPLMADFAAALRDVGEQVLADHGGRFTAVIEAAGSRAPSDRAASSGMTAELDGSAPALADLLAGWAAFADVSRYDGRAVPFFKRAQLVAADLDRLGVESLTGVDRLTAFADNLVPHVLRVDGVLRLDPALAAAIDAGEPLEHGSPPEVELRAGAVHAVELLAAAVGGRLCPAEIDHVFWNRGGDRRYKAIPRPRSRNTAY